MDKDGLLEFFESVLVRIPMSVVQKVFRSKKLTAGQNIDGTLLKIKSYLDHQPEEVDGDNDPEDYIRLLNEIADWYTSDYLLHGEKAVHFYEVSPSLASKAIDYFDRLDIPESIYQESYPLTVSDSELSKDDTETHLVDVSPHDDGIAVVYSTVRYYTERIDFTEAALNQSARELYSDAQGFHAVRHHYRQFFDVLIIYPDGRLEVRVDNPLMDKNKRLFVIERDKAFKRVKRLFEGALTSYLKSTTRLPAPKNLLGVVDRIYFTEGEGIVRLIKFTTNNSNAKEAKANSRIHDDCCRKDVFTEAGTKAVNGDINPYRIHVKWSVGDEKYIELRLLGTVDNIDIANTPLNEAIITKAFTKTQYEVIREKILM